jgi:hypothetical protein
MKIRANSLEDIPKRPYLSSFLQFKGTKLKKMFNPRNFWAELFGSQPKSSKFKPKNKRHENVKEKKVSKELAFIII